MDRGKLGEVIGAGLAGIEVIEAENLLPVFDNDELLAEVARRQLVVGDGVGLLAAANLVTSPLSVLEADTKAEYDAWISKIEKTVIGWRIRKSSYGSRP